jgi:hypothetical protein
MTKNELFQAIETAVIQDDWKAESFLFAEFFLTHDRSQILEATAKLFCRYVETYKKSFPASAQAGLALLNVENDLYQHLTIVNYTSFCFGGARLFPEANAPEETFLDAVYDLRELLNHRDIDTVYFSHLWQTFYKFKVACNMAWLFEQRPELPILYGLHRVESFSLHGQSLNDPEEYSQIAIEKRAQKPHPHEDEYIRQMEACGDINNQKIHLEVTKEYLGLLANVERVQDSLTQVQKNSIVAWEKRHHIRFNTDERYNEIRPNSENFYGS